MRKIILSIHTSLDGFAAGPNGEMNWIKIDDEMFDFVGKFTEQADMALYGRVTYQMMEAYWPTAAAQPNPSKHDIEHSAWYNRVEKVVLSRTMKGRDTHKTRFIAENISGEVTSLKRQPGRNILIFGSPSAARSLMAYNLIDEYWLFVNPVILGRGIRVFAELPSSIVLKPIGTKVFSCGVSGLGYSVVR